MMGIKIHQILVTTKVDFTAVVEIIPCQAVKWNYIVHVAPWDKILG